LSLVRPRYSNSKPGTAVALTFRTPIGVTPSPNVTNPEKNPGDVTVRLESKNGVPAGDVSLFAPAAHRLKLPVPGRKLTSTVTCVIAIAALDGSRAAGISTSSNRPVGLTPINRPGQTCVVVEYPSLSAGAAFENEAYDRDGQQKAHRAYYFGGNCITSVKPEYLPQKDPLRNMGG
jgi:hypothetical protein